MQGAMLVYPIAVGRDGTSTEGSYAMLVYEISTEVSVSVCVWSQASYEHDRVR